MQRFMRKRCAGRATLFALLFVAMCLSSGCRSPVPDAQGDDGSSPSAIEPALEVPAVQGPVQVSDTAPSFALTAPGFNLPASWSASGASFPRAAWESSEGNPIVVVFCPQFTTAVTQLIRNLQYDGCIQRWALRGSDCYWVISSFPMSVIKDLNEETWGNLHLVHDPRGWGNTVYAHSSLPVLYVLGGEGEVLLKQNDFAAGDVLALVTWMDEHTALQQARVGAPVQLPLRAEGLRPEAGTHLFTFNCRDLEDRYYVPAHVLFCDFEHAPIGRSLASRLIQDIAGPSAGLIVFVGEEEQARQSFSPEMSERLPILLDPEGDLAYKYGVDRLPAVLCLSPARDGFTLAAVHQEVGEDEFDQVVASVVDMVTQCGAVYPGGAAPPLLGPGDRSVLQCRPDGYVLLHFYTEELPPG